MAVGKQLSDANADGNSLGQSTTDKISFYNVTPIAQRSSTAQSTVATITWTQASPFGFSTSALAIAFENQLREVRDSLVALGLWKGSS